MMEGLILKLNYHSLSVQDQRSPAPTDYEHKGKMKGIAIRGNWHPKRSPLQLFQPESPPQAGGYMHALSIASRRKYSWLLFWNHRALCNNLTKTTFGQSFTSNINRVIALLGFRQVHTFTVNTCLGEFLKIFPACSMNIVFTWTWY